MATTTETTLRRAHLAIEARDRTQPPSGIPRWVHLGACGFVTLLVVYALAIGGSWLPLVVQIPLALLTVAPWVGVPSLSRRWFSPQFALCSTIPTLLLTWTGASPVLFGVLALAAARVAMSTGLVTSIGYGLAAIAIVVGRPLLGHPTTWWVWKTYVELGVAVGWAARAQLQLAQRDREALEEHERLALLEERRRIARDVHDALAHTLAILMVHLNSARMQLRDDPEGAAEVLDDVVEYGRRCLDEVRGIVGVLAQPTSTEPVGSPIEAATAIEDLVRSYRNAGADIDLRLDVEMANMRLLAQARGDTWTAAYRIARESLANAVKHAPGAAITLRIAVDDQCLHFECRNPVPHDIDLVTRHGRGHGLPGMRERVADLGGTLVAGAESREWVVRAELPLDGRRLSVPGLAGIERAS